MPLTVATRRRHGVKFAYAIALTFAFIASATPGIASSDPAYYFTHRPVSTKDVRAQALFDEGLTFYYAYNRAAAEARFRAAAARDPRLAAAWWGVALARGPNINVAMSADDEREAAAAVVRARALEAYASPVERDLIEALAVRYDARGRGNVKQRATAYARAMWPVRKRYPNDADVVALWMESALDVMYFGAGDNGLPAPDAIRREVVADEARWPEQIGVVHYFIHYTEPDTSPAALRAAVTLPDHPYAPPASHLVHMASHVLVYVGDWSTVTADNIRAAHMDMAAARDANVSPATLDYFQHNLEFWYGSSVMRLDERQARAAVAIWARYYPDMTWVLEDRFGHADATRAAMQKAGIRQRLARLSGMSMMGMGMSGDPTVQFLYGLACSDLGDTKETQRTLALLTADRTELTAVRSLQTDILQARLAELGGDAVKAALLYTTAATLQDGLYFETAPPWYYAPRERLAALDLRFHDPSAAVGVLRAELVHHPKSGPALELLQRAQAGATP